MDFNDWNSLPDWDDHNSLQPSSENNCMDDVPEYAIARQLYKKWQNLFLLLELYSESLTDSTDYDASEKNKEILSQHLFWVAPKIVNAAMQDSYVEKMYNASVIRYNCNAIVEQLRLTAVVGAGELQYAEVIELEMDAFRFLFIKWVASFKKDGSKDEWGLFV